MKRVMVLLSAILITAAGCRNARSYTKKEFETRVAGFERELVADYTDIRRITIETAQRKLDEFEAGEQSSRPTIEILMLSAGGANGAFGAGFLQGWGSVMDSRFARPKFDRVTGSSTGALMAPFAMLGTDDAYTSLVELYSNPGPHWIRSTVFGSILLGSESLFCNAGLRKSVRDTFDAEMLRAIGARGNDGEILLVGATNLDLGRFRVFDLTRIAADGDERLFEDVLLASSAIPGIFPPVYIDGWTYGDGGAVANLFLGVDRDLIWRETAGPWWGPEREALGTPKLRVRHWVIVNGKLDLDVQQTPGSWKALGLRALDQLFQAANVRTLQQLDVMRRLARRRPDVEFEVYWVAIPQDAVLPEPSSMFDEAYMRALVKLGQEMGASPGSWRTESPLLELDWKREGHQAWQGR